MAKCINCKLTQPYFNYFGENKPLYCSKCKLDKMVDIISPKCINCNLTQANKKYNNYCAFCFINLHPDDPIALKAKGKSKELQVVIHVLSKYNDFIYNKPFYVDLEGGCCSTNRRID